VRKKKEGVARQESRLHPGSPTKKIKSNTEGRICKHEEEKENDRGFEEEVAFFPNHRASFIDITLL